MLKNNQNLPKIFKRAGRSEKSVEFKGKNQVKTRIQCIHLMSRICPFFQALTFYLGENFQKCPDKFAFLKVSYSYLYMYMDIS